LQIFKNRWAFGLFFGLSVFIYFWNIWINDIWIPNEAFYAESVREMIERKNFLDITYNYEPRLNKPPLTYWSILISYLIFGVNEFATRLPIVLMALGTIFLTFKIAEELFGNRKISIISAFVMFFSLQFVINSRYASPEIPLSFFFTLTMYFFLIGYRTKKFKYIFLSYISLALVILTKGFPYLAVIGGIIVFYILWEENFRLKRLFQQLHQLKLYIGLPLVIVLGFSWYFYAYLKYGDIFIKTTLDETIHRAVGKKTSFKPFFYLIVILWGFLPYSLTFYYTFIEIKKYLSKFKFLLSWVIVMLIIFTLAKGKIPVYIIQAHVPMAILTAYFIVEYNPVEKWKKFIFYSTFIIPTILLIAVSIGVIYLFQLDYMYYWIAVFPIIYLIRFREVRLLPFISALIFFFIFVVSLLPKVEHFRPYDKIGQAVKDNLVNKNIPLIIENYFWHNLPFYTERKVLRDYSIKQIVEYGKNKPLLALIKEENLKYFPNSQVIWRGKLYIKGSESRFAVFLKYIYKSLNGDNSGFQKRILIIRY